MKFGKYQVRQFDTFDDFYEKNYKNSRLMSAMCNKESQERELNYWMTHLDVVSAQLIFISLRDEF